MSASMEPPASRSRMLLRKFGIGMNVAFSLCLIAVLWVMINYIASNHYRRFDLSRNQFYQLSDKTHSVLHNLRRPTRVVVFVHGDEELYPDIDNLLREYQAASSLLRVEYVDPDRDPEKSEYIINTYRIPRSGKQRSANLVIFAQSDPDNPDRMRRRFVSVGELTGQKRGALRRQEQVFLGEQLFTSALHSLASDTRPIVYFLEGHGEKSVDSFERGTGYAEVANELRRENIEVRPLSFGPQDQVPADCDALVIPGPTRAIPEHEISMLQQYLHAEGRLLLLLDAHQETALEELLLSWEIDVGDDMVVDPQLGRGADLYIKQYGDHPITRALHGINTIFYMPRSVDALQADPGNAADATVDRPRIVRLAACSPSGWSETDLEARPVEFDPVRDRRGPISFAVAAERGARESDNLTLSSTRLVVIGDSDFAANGSLRVGSVDFFLASVNWLVDREELLAISAKPVYRTTLSISEADMERIFLLVVLGIPACGAFLGLLVWMRRRT